jgi:hypothetical protein
MSPPPPEVIRTGLRKNSRFGFSQENFEAAFGALFQRCVEKNSSALV